MWNANGFCGGEAPSDVGLVTSVRLCIHPNTYSTSSARLFCVAAAAPKLVPVFLLLFVLSRVFRRARCPWFQSISQ